MRQGWVRFAAGLTIVVLIGCGPTGERSMEPESAPVTVRVEPFAAALAPGAAAADGIARIAVTVTAGEIGATIEAETGDNAIGTLMVPVGTGRVFTAAAYDAAGDLRRAGRTVADIAAGEPSPVTITLDPAPGGLVLSFPPIVTAVAPAAGAIGVPVQTAIRASFDTEMDPATLTPATVWAQNQQGRIAGTVHYDPTRRTLWFQPEHDLAPGQRYAATVSMDAADLDGRTLGQDVSWIFTTATGSNP